jgi:hypothetical protein
VPVIGNRIVPRGAVHRDLRDRSSTKDAARIGPVPQRRFDRLEAGTTEAMTKT